MICQHVEVNRFCGDPKLSVLWEGHYDGRKIALFPILIYFALLPKALEERLHSFVVLIYSLVPQLFCVVRGHSEEETFIVVL